VQKNLSRLLAVCVAGMVTGAAQAGGPATRAAVALGAGAPAAVKLTAVEQPVVAGSTGSGTDWPQWRGPLRNGIAPAGPKLLDAWPKEGPKLLWKSAPIPSGSEGGCGSVTVAGGRAFVFVHWRHKGKKNIVITTKMLNDLGWVQGVPDDLAKKVEQARVGEKVTYLNSRRQRKEKFREGEDLDAYIKTFLATLPAETAAKHGPFIKQRLYDTTFSWDQLVTMATVRDQEFTSWDDLRGNLEKKGVNLIFPGDDKYNAFRDQVVGHGYHYADTIICLDADTGKEIWKKEFPGVLPTPGMMMYIGASSTPAVWHDKCYVTGSAGLYCLSGKDGAVVWQAKTGFSNSSPLVHKGVVYCFVSQLTALDANTGEVRWIGEKALQTENASVVLWNSGGKDYLLGANGLANPGKHPIFVFCVDAATGKMLWSTGVPYGTFPTPVVEEDVMAMGSGQGWRITPESVTPLWSMDNHDYRGSSLLVHDGYVYLASGRYFGTPLRCFDLRTAEPKWIGLGDHGGNAEGASPIMADGKIFAQIKDPDAIPERGGSWTVMFRAAPEKFQELGQFHSEGATCASPSVANGKLYLRQQNAVACWDIAERRPYMDGARVVKDELVFACKQAEGGLAAEGAIEGLLVTDASGQTRSAKARLQGASLAVDLQDAVFPVTISYAAAGNLRAANGPVAPFEWRSPRLTFERCEGNTLVLKFDHYMDRELWKSQSSYAVAGAKVAEVQLDPSGDGLRLTTDKMWKAGEKTTVRYAAVHRSQGTSGRTAELSFIVAAGRPVTETPLVEFLLGELREKIDPATIFAHDDLDKNIKPVAGGKWQAFQGKCDAVEGSGCIDLNKCLGYHENALGHACVYVHAETDCKVRLSVYADDGMQILVNGQAVYTEPKSFQKKDIKDVALKQGWNTLLMGITQTAGFWGFRLSMRNEQGDGPPVGLRYAAALPAEKAAEKTGKPLASLPVQRPATQPAATQMARLSFPAPSAAVPRILPAAAADPVGWGQNWPRFRGPRGDGTAAADADPPVTINLAQHVLYRVPVPARGHSSPVVWGNRIFLTGDGERIMAFDRADGKLLWDVALPSHPPIGPPGDEPLGQTNKDTGPAAPTPCTDGRRVYAFFGSGVLGCVDFDGRHVWTQRLVRGRPRNGYGLAASPVLYGDLVIQLVDQGALAEENLSFLVALRAKDGVPMWGQERPVRSSWSTPLVYRGRESDELITSAPLWVIAYQPATGRELWRAKGLAGDVAASPIPGTGLIWTAGGVGGNEVLAVKPGGRGDVSKSGIAWAAEASVPDASSPVCDGKHYFHLSAAGELCCLDAATGKEQWTKELDGQYWASPVLVGTRVYAVNKKGLLSVVSTADGRVLSTVKLPEDVTASPAVLGPRIYIRTAGHLMCIGRP